MAPDAELQSIVGIVFAMSGPVKPNISPGLHTRLEHRNQVLPCRQVSVDGMLPGRDTWQVCLNVCHKNRYVEVR